MSENTEVPLVEIGVESDPGTQWHEATEPLPDLNPRELREHEGKPTMGMYRTEVLAAEDSVFSPEGEV